MNRLLDRFRATRDHGFTLVELLVSMIMLGIVGLIVATAASTALRTNAQSEVVVTKAADAQTAMDRLTRSLASAVNPVNNAATTPVTYVQGFASVGDFAVTYYANVKNLASNGATLVPQQVTDQVVPDPSHAGTYMLVESVVNGSANPSAPPAYVWTGTPTTHVLAYGVAKPDSSVTTPLFTYYQPRYFDAGLSGDVAVGVANCTAAVAPAATAYPAGTSGTFWVGAQPNTSVASTVATVQVTLTLSGTGTNAPQYAQSSKDYVDTALVDIDSANSYLSRDGTCE